MTSQREVEEPSGEQRERIATLELLLRLYLAEYNAVRDELTAAAQAQRALTEDGILILTALGGILAAVQAGLIPGSARIAQTFPGHYFFLLLPFAYLYLMATHLEQRQEEYMAQAYLVRVLRPRMRQVLRLCDSAGVLDLFEENLRQKKVFADILDWDAFRVQTIVSSDTRAAVGSVKLGLTTVAFVLLPILVFLIGTMTEKGYWSLPEATVVGVILGLTAAAMRAMLYFTQEIQDRTKQYRETGEIPHILLATPFKREEPSVEDS